MARSARKHVLRDNGYYHICTRGNDRRRLFRTSGDHKFLLETIAEYQKLFDVGIVHYSLMPNHLHFLLKAMQASDLPLFMKAILQIYAAYFRRRYHSVGYLFQNRYRAIPIKDEKHLLECGRYIERNPLRAKLVDNLDNYRWSSYLYYAYGKHDPLIKCCNPLYLQISPDPEQRMIAYRKMVLEERLYETIVDKEFKII